MLESTSQLTTKDAYILNFGGRGDILKKDLLFSILFDPHDLKIALEARNRQ